MPHTTVHVIYPHLYWLADKSCFPQLQTDPDIEDDRQPRHSDKYELDWKAIGDKVQCIGREIVSQQVNYKNGKPDSVTVNVDLSTLSDTEEDIVKYWFNGGCILTGDPCDLIDGRHRLFNCWFADETLLLPVQSATLRTTLEDEDSAAYKALPAEAWDCLNKIPDTVRQNSPEYVKQIEYFAEQFDAPIEPWDYDSWMSEPSEANPSNTTCGFSVRSLLQRIKTYFCK